MSYGRSAAPDDGRAVHGAGLRAPLLDEDAGADDAVPPGLGLALRVEPCAEVVVGRRTVVAVLQVVLARPYDFHGRLDGPGGLHRVGDEVRFPAAAEATTEHGRVHGHLLGRHAGQLGREGLMAAGALGRDPQRHAVGGDLRGAIHRLHAGVLEERHLVDALDRLAAGGAERLLGVADLLRLEPRLPGGLGVLPADLRARDGGHRAFVPLDLERLAPLERGPGAGGDDRHAVADLDDIAHALDLLGRGRVEALDLGSGHDGWTLDRGDQHAGHPDVVAVDGLAVGLRRQIHPRELLADVPELVFRLEPGILRYRKLLGLVHELAVEQLAARGLVDDRAGFGVDLVDRHAPLVGGGFLEHLAAGRARLAPGGEVVADAAAAAVGLSTGDRVGVELGIGGGLLDLHPGEIDVELVGDDHRHRRAGALTHLRHGVHDRHQAVSVDAEPLVRRELAGLRLREHVGRGQAEADDEAGADGGATLEEGATGDWHRGHDLPPFARAAARWIALRRRW